MAALTLKLRLYGDPCLRKKSAPVQKVGASERILIAAMLETMRQEKGLGLAAPQVGINQQIFVVDIGDGPIAVINPKILKRSGSHVQEEGCLSIPQVMVNIKRSKKITVEYTQANNEVVEKEFTDLLARVFLHENDHLHGKLIIDFVKGKERKELEEKLRELQKSQVKS